MKRPAFQFYPGDWLRDTALRSCSIAARGLWIDLMCFMHDGQPYGHLAVAGQPIPGPKLAQMVGLKYARFLALIQELEQAKVYAKSDSGALYSRRMVRDESVRGKRAAGGFMSLAHPNTPKPKGTLQGIPIRIEEGSSAGPPPAVAVASAPARERERALATPSSEAALWVEALCEEWSRAYQGTPPRARIAKHIEPLIDLYGPARVQANWRNYLAATDAKRASPAWFAEQFGAWETPQGSHPPMPAKPPATKMVAEVTPSGRQHLVEVPIDDPRPPA